MLISTCENPRCTRKIRQSDDPGRRRRYCSNACRQMAWRDRNKGASATPKANV